jgi:hypothetical protein
METTGETKATFVPKVPGPCTTRYLLALEDETASEFFPFSKALSSEGQKKKKPPGPPIFTSPASHSLAVDFADGQ